MVGLQLRHAMHSLTLNISETVRDRPIDIAAMKILIDVLASLGLKYLENWRHVVDQL